MEASDRPDDDPRTDPVGGLDAVWDATARLLATAHRVDEAALAQPSGCPGWSRAHVLGHLARNADGLTRLCEWARTGVPNPMYESAQSRAAGIETAARQPRTSLLEDLAASSERFASAFGGLSGDMWRRRVRLGPGGGGAEIRASRIGWQRLKEVEIHHVDLSFGYSPADWPEGFVDRALAQTLRMFRRRDDVPSVRVAVTGSEPEQLGPSGGPTVSGPRAPLLAWLTGRSLGEDLTVDPPETPPSLPAWA
ncbi:MAG TPA: maleylpyruvate isomerase family mycothiol-dependent enzyme [Jiangellales bacterium]|nr:maleylpyruvate isomerase family mycothiol-dependent enzyme [Jiangellales bacterium]